MFGTKCTGDVMGEGKINIVKNYLNYLSKKY